MIEIYSADQSDVIKSDECRWMCRAEPSIELPPQCTSDARRKPFDGVSHNDNHFPRCCEVRLYFSENIARSRESIQGLPPPRVLKIYDA